MVSSTDAPSKYWAQGKFYFITNGERSSFFVRGENNGEFDGDYLTADLENATMFFSAAEARKVVKTNEVYERRDFGKGAEGLALYHFWQEAQIGVLIYKARDLRLHTHLQKGD